jgi:hypothetical protein
MSWFDRCVGVSCVAWCRTTYCREGRYGVLFGTITSRAKASHAKVDLNEPQKASVGSGMLGQMPGFIVKRPELRFGGALIPESELMLSAVG